MHHPTHKDSLDKCFPSCGFPRDQQSILVFCKNIISPSFQDLCLHSRDKSRHYLQIPILPKSLDFSEVSCHLSYSSHQLRCSLQVPTLYLLLPSSMNLSDVECHLPWTVTCQRDHVFPSDVYISPTLTNIHLTGFITDHS